MNKVLFKQNLNNKNYSECIKMLRADIIDFLVFEIQKSDKNFKFKTTKNLYEVAQKILDFDNIQIAFELYNLDLLNYSEIYILNQLMELHSLI